MAEDIRIELPKEIINAHIQSAIVRALGEDSDRLVRSIVELALAKKEHSYDRKTIFEQAVEQMIREEAEKAFRDWLMSKRDLIQHVVATRLGLDGSKIIEETADGIVACLSTNVKMTVQLEPMAQGKRRKSKSYTEEED